MQNSVLESHDSVDVFPTRRQHDDGYFTLLAQTAKDLEPIQAGEHDVEHDQVVSTGQCSGKAGVSFVLAFHRETFALKELAQERAELTIVVDQQDGHG